MKRELSAVLLVLALGSACASRSAPSAPSAPNAPSRAPTSIAAAPIVEGDIFVKGASTASGTLVLGWHTVAERKEIEGRRFNLAIARRMLDRWRVGQEVDFAKTARVHYRLEGAPPDAAPAVILDVEHSFWPTVFGAGRGMTGTAKSGGGDVELAPNPPRPSRGEPCSGPRYKLLEIDGAGLAPSASPQASAATTKFIPTEHGHANGEDRIESALRFALERLDVAE